MKREKYKKIGLFWKNYNLSIVLFALFLLSWICQFLVQIKEVASEASEKGKIFEWNDLWIKFWSSTLENWQSEFLQLFTFVLLTAYLVHKNSHESKDSDERIEKKLDKVLSILSHAKDQKD